MAWQACLCAVAAAHLSPDRVAGIGLLASLGLRAHHGLQASRPKLSWGLLSMPFVGRAIRPVLPVAFKAFGFPGDQPVEALVRVMQLAANVDVLAHAERVRTLPVPALVAWTDDDRLITSDISRELSEAAPEGPRLCWPEGGHFFLKTRSVELADALVAWVATPEALIPRGPLSETSRRPRSLSATVTA